MIKDYITEFDDCIKSPNTLSNSKLKATFGMDGIIYYCDSNKKPPRWKPYLDQWAKDTIDISDNSSNKAIMLVKVKIELWLLFLDMADPF